MPGDKGGSIAVGQKHVNVDAIDWLIKPLARADLSSALNVESLLSTSMMQPIWVYVLLPKLQSGILK